MKYIIMLVVLATSTIAQADARVVHLRDRILARIPDLPATRHALGRGEQERLARATAHAQAIVAAADTYKARWQEFAERAGWSHFVPERDLPALIAAITLRESAFQSVVRLDDNTRVYMIPPRTRVDAGVMQVRAPSAPARQCGVERRQDAERLLTDLVFSYRVGTCVLTNRLDYYIDIYRRAEFRRLRWDQRPPLELRFYGVFGPRRGSEEAAVARELVVLERYNWGGSHLYTSRRGAGYARRVLREFEYFRRSEGNTPDS